MTKTQDLQSKTTEYRGFVIQQNFLSIHGTRARLQKPRGWILSLPTYGEIGWHSNLEDAKRDVDSMRRGKCNGHIKLAIKRLDAAALATV